MNELKYFYTENGLDLNIEMIKNTTKDGVRDALSESRPYTKEVNRFGSEDGFMFDDNISDDCTDFVVEIIENNSDGSWGDNYYIYSLEHYIEKCKITLNELLQYKEGN